MKQKTIFKNFVIGIVYSP